MNIENKMGNLSTIEIILLLLLLLLIIGTPIIILALLINKALNIWKNKRQ